MTQDHLDRLFALAPADDDALFEIIRYVKRTKDERVTKQLEAIREDRRTDIRKRWGISMEMQYLLATQHHEEQNENKGQGTIG